MTIDVDNSPADLIQTIFATLIVQGDQLDYFGVIPVPSISQGGHGLHADQLDGLCHG